MKKIILLFFLMFVTLNARAQTSADKALIDSLTVSKYTYCQIVGTANLIGTKVTIELDFGQARKFLQNKTYMDSDGKPIKFNSMVDAMNFMGKNG